MNFEYVDATAAALGIPLDDELRAAVAGDMERIRAIAEFLMEFPLEQGVEVAPVFRP
jgi:hypothetical protein